MCKARGVPSPYNSKMKDGHPLVKLDARGDAFKIFLHYAHRDELVVDGTQPEPL